MIRSENNQIRMNGEEKALFLTGGAEIGSSTGNNSFFYGLVAFLARLPLLSINIQF